MREDKRLVGYHRVMGNTDAVGHGFVTETDQFPYREAWSEAVVPRIAQPEAAMAKWEARELQAFSYGHYAVIYSCGEWRDKSKRPTEFTHFVSVVSQRNDAAVATDFLAGDVTRLLDFPDFMDMDRFAPLPKKPQLKPTEFSVEDLPAQSAREEDLPIGMKGGMKDDARCQELQAALLADFWAQCFARMLNRDHPKPSPLRLVVAEKPEQLERAARAVLRFVLANKLPVSVQNILSYSIGVAPTGKSVFGGSAAYVLCAGFSLDAGPGGYDLLSMDYTRLDNRLMIREFGEAILSGGHSRYYLELKEMLGESAPALADFEVAYGLFMIDQSKLGKDSPKEVIDYVIDTWSFCDRRLMTWYGCSRERRDQLSSSIAKDVLKVVVERNHSLSMKQFYFFADKNLYARKTDGLYAEAAKLKIAEDGFSMESVLPVLLDGQKEGRTEAEDPVALLKVILFDTRIKTDLSGEELEALLGYEPPEGSGEAYEDMLWQYACEYLAKDDRRFEQALRMWRGCRPPERWRPEVWSFLLGKRVDSSLPEAEKKAVADAFPPGIAVDSDQAVAYFTMRTRNQASHYRAALDDLSEMNMLTPAVLDKFFLSLGDYCKNSSMTPVDDIEWMLSLGGKDMRDDRWNESVRGLIDAVLARMPARNHEVLSWLGRMWPLREGLGVDWYCQCYIGYYRREAEAEPPSPEMAKALEGLLRDLEKQARGEGDAPASFRRHIAEYYEMHACLRMNREGRAELLRQMSALQPLVGDAASTFPTWNNIKQAIQQETLASALRSAVSLEGIFDLAGVQENDALLETEETKKLVGDAVQRVARMREDTGAYIASFATIEEKGPAHAAWETVARDALRKALAACYDSLYCSAVRGLDMKKEALVERERLLALWQAQLSKSQAKHGEGVAAERTFEWIAKASGSLADVPVCDLAAQVKKIHQTIERCREMQPQALEPLRALLRALVAGHIGHGGKTSGRQGPWYEDYIRDAALCLACLVKPAAAGGLSVDWEKFFDWLPLDFSVHSQGLHNDSPWVRMACLFALCEDVDASHAESLAGHLGSGIQSGLDRRARASLEARYLPKTREACPGSGVYKDLVWPEK